MGTAWRGTTMTLAEHVATKCSECSQSPKHLQHSNPKTCRSPPKKLLNVSNLSQNGHSERKKKSKPRKVAKKNIPSLILYSWLLHRAGHITYITSTKGYSIPIKYSKMIWNINIPCQATLAVSKLYGLTTFSGFRLIRESANQPCSMELMHVCISTYFTIYISYEYCKWIAFPNFLLEPGWFSN